MYFLIRKRFFSKAEKRENGVELLTHKTKWPRDRLVMTFFSKVWFIFFVAPLREKTKFETIYENWQSVELTLLRPLLVGHYQSVIYAGQQMVDGSFDRFFEKDFFRNS